MLNSNNCPSCKQPFPWSSPDASASATAPSGWESRAVAPPSQSASRTPNAAPAPGEPSRKKSAYIVYVHQQLSTPEIKRLTHKEKMNKIALNWKAQSAEQKEKYKEMARQENEMQTETA